MIFNLTAFITLFASRGVRKDSLVSVVETPEEERFIRFEETLSQCQSRTSNEQSQPTTGRCLEAGSMLFVEDVGSITLLPRSEEHADEDIHGIVYATSNPGFIVKVSHGDSLSNEISVLTPLDA